MALIVSRARTEGDACTNTSRASSRSGSLRSAHRKWLTHGCETSPLRKDYTAIAIPGSGKPATTRRYCSTVMIRSCQCRVNFPQKCRSKIPQFGRSARRGELRIFRWSSAWSRRRIDRRWRNRSFRPQVFRHEFGVLPQPVTAWCSSRSSSAVATTGSPKTSPIRQSRGSR